MKKYIALFAALLSLSAIFVSCNREIDPVEKELETTFNWENPVCVPPVVIVDIAKDNLGTIERANSFIRNEADQQKQTLFKDSDLSWTSLGTSIITGCCSGLGSFAVNRVLSELFPSTSDSAACLEKLDEVISQLDTLNMKIDDIAKSAEQIYERLNEIQLNEMYQAWNEINRKIDNLSSANELCFSQLRAASESKMADDDMTKIIDRWAYTVVGGNSVYIAVESIAQDIYEFSKKYNGKDMNYFSVFDMNVFNSVPWESMGYIYREQYRAKVAAELARGFYLLGFFYSAYNSTNNLESLKRCAASFEDMFKENEVVYHKDQAICQISGAHFKLNVTNTFLDRQKFVDRGSYLNTTSEIALANEGHEDYSWDAIPDKYYEKLTDNYTNNFIEYQLDTAETGALYRYYADYAPSKSLLDIFRDGGVKVPSDYKCSYTYDGAAVISSTNDVYFGVKQTYFDCTDSNPDIYEDKQRAYVPTGEDEIYFEIKNYYDANFPVSKVRYSYFKFGTLKLHIIYAGPLATYGSHIFPEFSNYPNDIQPSVVKINEPDIYWKGKDSDGNTVYHFNKYCLHHDIDFPGNHFLFIAPGAIERY